ncbi:amino acid ABC transporter substrate-binding protein [Nonomuraea sp. NPDC050394]|uniref:amino acid ABC transporter substrate-binding protein n=1 Tax=Nonomuraea sp. NPDC050394 TaxID=3364363 RepID=UPI0037A9E967
MRRMALAAATVLALAACGQPPSAQRGGGGDLVIGISLPLSGDFAQPGGEAKRGYEVWRDLVNAKGGMLGRKVRLKIVDDASNQDTVVADYTKLITQDRVDFVLGTFSSLLNYPASAVAEKNRMVFIEPAGGAAKMFERGFKHLFFAQPAASGHQADVFAEWIRSLPENRRPKTAAYPSQDDPFAKPVIDSLRAQLEAQGVRTVNTDVYPGDTTNFQTLATTLGTLKPDLIAQGAVFEDGVGLVRALKQLGYSPKMLFQTSAPSNGEQYANGVGTASTEGVLYTVSWNEKAKTPLNAEFVAAYRKAHGNAPPAEDAADAFAAAQVLQAATEKVGAVDQEKISAWLHANTVETILGPLSWMPTGEPKGSFMLAQWQGGTVEVIAPKNLATTANVVNPKPGWKAAR